MYKTTTLVRNYVIALLLMLPGITRLQALIIFLLFAGLVSSHSAGAQFSGNYAPSQWTLSSNPSNIGGSVDASGAPSSISLTSGNNNNGAGNTIYSVTIPATGTISFNWSYTTFDDSPYDYPMYMINGTPVNLTGYDINGGQPQNGTESNISVHAGDIFSLVMYTEDGASGPATTVFSNFTGPTAPPSITGQPSNTTVCASANTSFTITASSASSYQWQVNTGSGFTNVSNGGVYSGATTTTLSITGATAGMNGYTYKCVATGFVSPAATSNSATLTVNSTNTWVGGTSSSWNTTANWSCGILPTASTNVTIPSGTTYSPQVNITTATCNNLTINSGATLSFSGTTNVLDVKGTITNNGTFTASSGTLKLSYSGTQTIPGLAYKNLTLNASGVKTLAAAASISGTLTLTTGFLQLGANDLTLTGTTSTTTAVNASAPTSFIITNSTGKLKIQSIGTGGRTGAVAFPIGTSSSSYTPVTITNTGTSDDFGARVINNVYRSYDASDVPNGSQQNTYNVGKTWLLTEGTAGGSNATLNFGWSSFDEQPGFNDGACFVAHFYGGTWHATNINGATANGFDPYDMSLTNVTSFSPFAIGSQFSILPLNLLSFTGKTNEGNNVLTWVSANEKAFTGFDVERSSDGRSYQRIGNVPARANNSGAQTTYTYTDASATAGTWYYRLKMIDNDGNFQYSTVVQINNSASKQAVYSLQPNSVKGNELNLVSTQTDAEDVQVRIIDAVGREWHKETIRANAMSTGKVSIATPALPLGMYFLQVRSVKTGSVQLLKFSKE